LIDEIKPANDATTNQTTARVKQTPTTKEVDLSASSRAFASLSLTELTPSLAVPVACCNLSICAAVAAGSSTLPSSLGTKISVAAWKPSPKRPFDKDQMKTKSAAIDKIKVPKSTLTVKSINANFQFNH
jgi:hypothetical protein